MPLRVRGKTLTIWGDLQEAIETEAKARGISAEELVVAAIEKYVKESKGRG